MRSYLYIVMPIVSSLMLAGCSLRSAPLPPSNLAMNSTLPQVEQNNLTGGWQEFTTTDTVEAGTQGHDGDMWFSAGSGNQVLRVDMSGNMSYFTVGGTLYSPGSIILNQGNIYVAEQYNGGYALAQISQSGTVTDIPIPTGGEVLSMVSASNDSIWMTRFDPVAVARLSIKGGYRDFTGAISAAGYLTNGPDKNIWVTALDPGNVVARFNPSDGALTTYPAPSNTQYSQLYQGADGGLWMTYDSTQLEMLRFDPSNGAVTTYPVDFEAGILANGPNNMLYLGGDGPGRVIEWSPIHHVAVAHWV